MNRRGFLKLVAVAVGGPCLPVAHKVAQNQHSGFDPRKEYAHAIRATVWATPEGWSTPAGQQLLSHMHVELNRNMQETIPPAYRNQVQWGEKWIDFGTIPCIAWRYTPKEAAV